MEDLKDRTDRQLLEEIHENARKTKNYLIWQLIITVALVVIPLLAMGFVLTHVLSGLTAAYGGGLAQ